MPYLIPKMRLQDLVDNTGIKLDSKLKDLEIKGVSSNSKQVQKDCLFVAIEGENFDGHDFIHGAIKAGAKVIIYQADHKIEDLQKTNNSIIFLPVKDSRPALSSIASKFYQEPSKKLKVIGITGTNGKTTITYLLENILKTANKRTGVIGTINYRFLDCQIKATNTTPGPLDTQRLLRDMVEAHIDYVIMEVSSHALDQDRVRDVEFKTSVFTNLTQDHLDYHKDLEAYFQAKKKLFIAPFQSKPSIINGDDPYGIRLINEIQQPILTYGLKKELDIYATDIKLTLDNAQFQVKTPKGELKIKTSLLGIHNIYNILASIGTCLSLGIDSDSIIEGISKLKFVPGRLQKILCGQNYHIFIDYAHTDDALKNILSSLRNIRDSIKTESRIIIVFGCGGDRDKTKRRKMGLVASSLADFCIITNDNPRNEEPQEIANEIIKGIKNKNFEVILDRFQAIKKALSLARDNDIVVIAGKGHENYQIFKDRTIPFDDSRVVKEILSHPR